MSRERFVRWGGEAPRLALVLSAASTAGGCCGQGGRQMGKGRRACPAMEEKERAGALDSTAGPPHALTIWEKRR